MLDVLLVQPIKDGFMAKFPPMGLAYVATAVERAGYRVKLLDCIADRYDYDAFAKYVRENKPRVVGFTMFSNALISVKKHLQIVKDIDTSIVTIVGGPHPSGSPEHTLKYLENADFSMIGEGEFAFPMFLEYIFHNSRKREEIPGLTYRENGHIKYNKQDYIDDLDSLQPLNWDFLDPIKYQEKGTVIDRNSAVIVSTRGCPFDCTFCSAMIIAGKNVRRRSIDNIMDEMKYLQEKFNISKFVLPDENITLNPTFIKAFCNGIIKNNFNVNFILPNGIRLDTLTDEILELMLKAGFSTRVAVGIESGSNKILKLMKKSLTVEKVEEKLNLMHRKGFRPIGYFIIGFPGETYETIMQTIELSLRLPLYGAAFTAFLPLPGTSAYHSLIASGELADGFDFSQLTTNAVTYAPKGMTYAEIKRLRKYAILRFHLRPKIIFDHMKDLNTFLFALRKFVSLFSPY